MVCTGTLKGAYGPLWEIDMNYVGEHQSLVIAMGISRVIVL